MEETKNTAALILNRQAYKEDASLVTVYTRYFGKLNLVARGTQKLQSKLAGHIEPLTLADLMIIKGKGYDYVGGILTRESYLGIRSDLNKLYYAGQAVNIFNRLVREGEPDERLFFLLANWFALLNDFTESKSEKFTESKPKKFVGKVNSRPNKLSSEFSSDSGELLLSFFKLKFLKELGYNPEMYKCLVCNKNIKPGKNYFNLFQGRVLCSSCYKNEQQGFSLPNDLMVISDDCIKIIRFIIDKDSDQLIKLKINTRILKELSKLTNNFLQFQI